MAQISIYQLSLTPLEKALPKLLEKVIQSGGRAVVLAASPERVEDLTNKLWTYAQQAFLPHGNIKDGMAEHQPIWLTDTVENPNNSSMLVLTDGMTTSNWEGFSKGIDIFDGTDAENRELAKQRISDYIIGQHDIKFWKQSQKGQWEQQDYNLVLE